jgi:UDP-N-acetylglucosamine--N-acetylmuramyl-(pentapeptide) pyrophosphoryl-undecaprenol N-acetylglucosamine transferase
MAGGTGGHIFPGLAVAESLRDQGWDIHWLGAEGKMEQTIVPNHGFALSVLNISGIRGKGFLSLLGAPFRILKAIWSAKKIIDVVKPDVILGMGGFTSGPGGVAGWIKQIPIVLHEQNAIAGLTNRWLSHVATKVLTGFDKTFVDSDIDKFRWVGNPLRSRMVNSPLELGDRFRILIVGGSLGSRPLNQWVPKAFGEAGGDNWQVRHQCGAGNQAEVRQGYEQYASGALHVEVEEFIEDMSAAYQWADIVICRAGALTVSELAQVGRPAIFVPLPHAVDDHQTFNAKFLVDIGGAILLPQTQLEQNALPNILLELQSQPEKLKQMAIFANKAAKSDATIDVVRICKQLAGDVNDHH